MKELVPIALVVFLIALGGSRLWASRCLRFLSVEQKALVLDSSSQSSIWLPASLALFAAIILWLPGLSLPSYYRPGAFASYVIIPLLLSAAISTGSLIRLSRLALPPSYLRGVRLAADR